MNNAIYRSMALAFVPAVVTALLVQACSSGSDAVAQAPAIESADPVEGLWDSIATARDCASGQALATFRGMNLFHRGGTLSDTNAAPTVTRGPGFGTWKRNGAGPTYTATFRFFLYNPDGSFAGLQRVTRNLTLSADGNSTTSNNTAQTIDPAGNVVANLCVTDVSTRAN